MSIRTRVMAYFANRDFDKDGPFKSDVTELTGNIITFPGGKVGWTVEGAEVIRMINDTGAPSIKGNVVKISDSNVDRGVSLGESSCQRVIGLFYEDVIPNGGEIWVAINGRCQVLLKDETVGTKGWLIRISDTMGRVECYAATLPGEGDKKLDNYLTTLGYCLDNVKGGKNQYCYVMFHKK